MAPYSRGIAPALALTIASALWGIATVVSKALLGSVPPITFLIVQLVPSVCVLWLLVFATGSVSWQGFIPLALLRLLNPGLSYTLSMFGLTMTTASVATLLWASEPALIVLTAWLLRQETTTPRFLVATGTAALGVLLVTGVGSGSNLEGVSVIGAALILGGVVCCAVYTVLSRRIAPTIDPLPAVAIQQTAGLACALSIWPIEMQGNVISTLSQGELLGGALSGLMYYAAAFALYLNALRTVPATTAGMFLNFIPVFGVATAWIFLGERLSLSQWAGAITILLSVFALLTWASDSQDQK